MKKPLWAKLADEAFEKADEAFAAARAEAEAEGREVELPDFSRVIRIHLPTFVSRFTVAFRAILKGKILIRLRKKL